MKKFIKPNCPTQKLIKYVRKNRELGFTIPELSEMFNLHPKTVGNIPAAYPNKLKKERILFTEETKDIAGVYIIAK